MTMPQPEPLNFANEAEEIEFLRYAIGHLLGDPGRSTAGGSMSHDLGWDLLEQYRNEVMPNVE